jgi:glycosyltransferase involved in cell wall biosynthesis
MTIKYFLANKWKSLVLELGKKFFPSRMKSASFLSILEEIGEFKFSNFRRLSWKFLIFKLSLLERNLLHFIEAQTILLMLTLYGTKIKKNERATIALIIVSYGDNPHLSEALNSVAKQSESPDEIVLVLSGTQQQTTKMIVAANNSELNAMKIIISGENQAGANRNIGASTTSSSHLLFLDGDDILKSKAVEIFRLHATMYRSRTIASSCSLFPNISYYHLLPKISHRSLRQFNQLNITTLLSADLFRELHGFRDSNIEFEHQPEDWDFWFRLTKVHKPILSIQDVLFRYRVHSNSTTSHSNQFKNEKSEYWRYAISTNEKIYWKSNYTLIESENLFSQNLVNLSTRREIEFTLYADNLQAAIKIIEENRIWDRKIMIVLKREDITLIDEFEIENPEFSVVSLFNSFIGLKARLLFLVERNKSQTAVIFQPDSRFSETIKKIYKSSLMEL